VNGQLTYKLDIIATVNINGQKYFNVFRRYNSPYDYVIEDASGDHYCHKDYTVRESLRAVLCLSKEAADHIYTKTATSYKHNAPVPSMPTDIADMRWSQIQQLYYAVDVDFEGILEEYAQVCENCKRHFKEEEKEQEPTDQEDDAPEVPHTPRNQIVNGDDDDEPVAPPAPKRRRLNDTANATNAANVLVRLNITPIDTSFWHCSESDKPTLSMRFEDICDRKGEFSTSEDEQMEDESSTDSYELESSDQSSGSESESESEESIDESTDESSEGGSDSMELSDDDYEISFDYSDDDEITPIDENDYIMLRNGTAVPKFKYQH
jgi:hypothetical protein